MILSLMIVLALGVGVSWIFKKINLPSLIGYLILGIVIGPFGLNIISDGLLNNAAIFRSMALVIILIRAGLSLDLKAFKKMGRPVILLSFLPALLEVIIVGLVGPLIFNIGYMDAFLLGAVIASVSPAVIIPRMIKMIEEDHGTEALIPETIITGSSLDDIVVITIFTMLLSIKTGTGVSAFDIARIPLELILGILVGALLGYLLNYIVNKFNINQIIVGLIIITISSLLYFFEELILIKGLLAILAFVIVYSYKNKKVETLEVGYKKLWFIAEILLFSLVGMGLDLNNFISNIGGSVLIIGIALIFRVIGTYISLYKSRYKPKEKLFIVMAYLPKATVQAAIGALALEAGLESGMLILSMSIAAILITAPLGALLIDKTKYILIDK